MTLDYAEELISNYEHPHNKGKMDGADAQSHEFNPVCGDDLTVYIKVIDGKLLDVRFDGTGCAISIASASLLTDEVKGKSLSEIERMGFEELKRIIGIDPGPVRLKCATLSLKALKEAVFLYEHKPLDAGTRSL